MCSCGEFYRRDSLHVIVQFGDVLDNLQRIPIVEVAFVMKTQNSWKFVFRLSKQSNSGKLFSGFIGYEQRRSKVTSLTSSTLAGITQYSVLSGTRVTIGKIPEQLLT